MNKKILVINCGSSSLKYEVYSMPDRISLGKGLVERIGSSEGHLKQKSSKGLIEYQEPIENHSQAMVLVIKALTDKDDGVITNLNDISAIGHRTVHGGEDYASSILITDHVIQAIKNNIELAPLHNPANLIGIQESFKIFPDCPQVAVFDTAFHQTIPPAAYLYGLDRKFYDEYRIRRYGFHGTSHRYVSNEAMRLLKRSSENTNVISCHLGNGASITSIVNGESRDTSMGFTPLEGLVMGTRSGDIDPAIVLYLLDKGFTKEQVNQELNKKGGMLGLSGISNDMRDIRAAAKEGHTNAIQALEVYAHRIRRYVGAYAANMYRVDALIFTGGIGENDFEMRERICHRLENLGIVMDYEKNKLMGNKEGLVSKGYSNTAILIIPTNEELQIAIDTFDIVFG
ncbi:MAG: acetate kinase [Spirochaetales bacterium]|nr:acetate kinase [Spirochaetales bacterium]